MPVNFHEDYPSFLLAEYNPRTIGRSKKSGSVNSGTYVDFRQYHLPSFPKLIREYDFFVMDFGKFKKVVMRYIMHFVISII